jgi:excisionase family DNA binding protein
VPNNGISTGVFMDIFQQGTSRPTDKLAFRVPEFCRAIGIGRTTFYKMVKEGLIDTVKIGGMRLVPWTAVERLLAGTN